MTLLISSLKVWRLSSLLDKKMLDTGSDGRQEPKWKECSIINIEDKPRKGYL